MGIYIYIYIYTFRTLTRARGNDERMPGKFIIEFIPNVTNYSDRNGIENVISRLENLLENTNFLDIKLMSRVFTRLLVFGGIARPTRASLWDGKGQYVVQTGLFKFFSFFCL